MKRKVPDVLDRVADKVLAHRAPARTVAALVGATVAAVHALGFVFGVVSYHAVKRGGWPILASALVGFALAAAMFFANIDALHAWHWQTFIFNPAY
jgi:phosphate/sulfate permease